MAIDSLFAPLSGRFWRMLGVRWQQRPFDSGSHVTGGRFNPPGVLALYLSRDYNTAIAEMHQDLIRPGTLVAYDVTADVIVDLTDPAICEKLKVTASDLACAWRTIHAIERGVPPTWPLVDRLVAADCAGALVPSFQRPDGVNLVLWRWHDAATAGDGAALTLLDPTGELGAGAPA
ncbi:RES family NAD+ phosphorylase [Sphingomonas sp. SUN019]|uniref:RES family NAD+ phosphorylase n=1 Tax=Sphingomonas sp. SUN019 TaxID=2937788 RepID=UPI0021643883|nr:RES family NAD+ phosphorylase [Sphingomonas sp. SUN019]UVO51373.1 RES family NAD+ phosphorylase [Sphingomonas sp. SUN019]